MVDQRNDTSPAEDVAISRLGGAQESDRLAALRVEVETELLALILAGAIRARIESRVQEKAPRLVKLVSDSLLPLAR